VAFIDMATSGVTTSYADQNWRSLWKLLRISRIRRRCVPARSRVHRPDMPGMAPVYCLLKMRRQTRFDDRRAHVRTHWYGTPSDRFSDRRGYRGL